MSAARIEIELRVAWKRWGDGYAMFTACSSCGKVKACRGKTRQRMLCLECFDSKKWRRKKR